MLKALFIAMRPRQWVKNIFIFAPLVFDKKLTDLPALMITFAGAVLFSMVASSIYLLNDIADLKADRQHHRKKLRPIASGALPISAARASALVLLITSLVLAFLISPAFFLVCLVYFILNLSYSLWLKHIVVLDVMLLSSFYVLRVVAGVAIIEVERFSPWLYLAASSVALVMGIGKRRAELLKAQGDENNTRKVLQNYTLPYLDNLLMIVITITIMTYSLYTFVAPNLPESQITMLTIPFVIFGVFRYLYLLQVEGHGEAPEEIVLSDFPFIVNILIWGLSIIAIFYLL
ncbi:MAG: decaprenyl-phosphate phosphoribosyltransferase [Anaerolineales bacterium]|nr:decaprenyl-phosphate phosphoribosyltransferase [Anaerolineales bacterium]